MRILHMYDDLMNLYGDYGNVRVLEKHLRDQGADVETDTSGIGDFPEFGKYDMIYIGSGTESHQEMARKDILRHQRGLMDALGCGSVILATGNAMELFGESIDDRECLGMVPVKTVTTSVRSTGDVVVTSPFTGDAVGFINRSTRTSDAGEKSLFTYVFRASGIPEDDTEGFRRDTLFGTHLTGPLLVKNPSLLEWMVEYLTLRGGNEYRKIAYPLQEKIHRSTLEALMKRKK